MSDLERFWPGWLPDALRVRLEAAYGDSGRGYHDRRHLTEVLEHVDALLGPADPAREAVLLAAWFHDAVYDGRADDEERSALLAEQELHHRPELATEVGRLVRLTATHRPADDDRPGAVLCDADLAVLAADADRYASYTAGVRAEHAHVSDAEFAEGRAAVLRGLLDKPTLFHTTAGRRAWETRARANLERETRHLEAGLLGPPAAAPRTGTSGSSARKAVVERYLEGFRRTDHDQILSCLAEDVVWELWGHTTVRGKDAFDAEIENDTTQGRPDLRIDRLVEEDDVVVAIGRGSVALAAGGTLEFVFSDVFTFTPDDLVSRLETYQVDLP